VNVYHRAAEDNTAEALTEWGRPPPRTIFAGDFNAVRWTWQSGMDPDAAGNKIAEWAEEHELLPALTESPTRR
jgi:hypothetical protein